MLKKTWKPRLARLARSAVHGIQPLVVATGLGRLGLLRALRAKTWKGVLRWLQSGDLLLVEAGGHPIYVFNRPHFIGVYLHQSYERYTLQLFRDAVRPGATVLDLGANIGCFSLVAAGKAGPQGRVYAFEPGPENLQVLKRNMEINGFANITVVPKAVGEESKTVLLHLAVESDLHSLFVPPIVGTKGTISVECIALDEFLDGTTPDVVKIDVEGNELRVLDGMRETVARSKALVMFVELNPVCLREARAQPRDLIVKLRDLGFELGIIDEDARAVATVTDDYLVAIERRPPGWFANLYCTKGLPNPCTVQT